MKTKKWKALLLATILIVSTMLSACGGNQTSKTQETSTESQTAEQRTETKTDTDSSLKEYPVISWYMPALNDDWTKDQEMVEEAANAILREKVGCELKFYFISLEDYSEKMGVMVNAGEKFDIMCGYLENKLDVNYDKGALLGISDLLQEYGGNILEKVDERAWASVTRMGEIYAIPSQTPWATANMFTLKTDLVEKYNLDISSVQKLEDLESFLQDVKENEEDIVPIYATASTSIFDAAYKADSVGVYEKMDAGSPIVFNYEHQAFESIFSQESFLRNMQVMHDYYEKGYIAKDALTVSEDTCVKGLNAVFYGGEEYTGGEKTSSQYGFPCTEIFLNRNVITNSAIQTLLTFVSSTSEQPELAVKVLNEVWGNPDLLNTLAYGVEGVHYTVIDGEGTEDKSVEPVPFSEATWVIFHNFLGPLWDQWDSSWNAKEALEKYEIDNNESPMSELVGFSFVREPVKTQLVELEAIYAEVIGVIRTGAMPDYDKYVEEIESRLDSAGLEKVLEEYQTQYEEWLTTK